MKPRPEENIIAIPLLRKAIGRSLKNRRWKRILAYGKPASFHIPMTT